jgi:hypothetical protein
MTNPFRYLNRNSTRCINRQISFVCLCQREMTSTIYLLPTPVHLVSATSLPPQGQAGIVRGPNCLQVIKVESLTAIPSNFTCYFSSSYPFQFATGLSLCGLWKLVTAFGWFDWSSGNGFWWRRDLQRQRLPRGVIYQHTKTGTQNHAHCLVKALFRYHIQGTEPLTVWWPAFRKCCLTADIE